MRFHSATGPVPGDMPAALHQTLVGAGHLPADCVSHPMTGGRTNRLWRASGHGGEIVIKAYAPCDDNPLFSNDPTAEALILHHLKDTGLAPKLHGALDTSLGPVVVYALVHGRPWQQNVAPVARELARLHKSTMPHGLPAAPDGSQALVDQTLAILSLCPEDAAKPITAYRPAGLAPPSGIIALLHGDAVPGNLIDTGTGITFIDWQCPCSGDPVHDLAIFLSPAMQHIYRGAPLSPDEEDSFLSAYGDKLAAARYHALAPWFHWRMAAYCLWRTIRGDADYQLPMAMELERLTG